MVPPFSFDVDATRDALAGLDDPDHVSRFSDGGFLQGNTQRIQQDAAKMAAKPASRISGGVPVAKRTLSADRTAKEQKSTGRIYGTNIKSISD